MELITALLKVLNKFKFALLLLLVLCFASSYYLSKYDFEYHSTAGILVNKQPDEIRFKDEFNRLDNTVPLDNNFEMIIKSTKVFDHLIARFDLIKYYGIGVKNPFRYEVAYNCLNENIKVIDYHNGFFDITVSDKNQYMCAKIAVEAINFVDSMQRYMIQKTVEGKLKMIQKYVKAEQQETGLWKKDVTDFFNTAAGQKMASDRAMYLDALKMYVYGLYKEKGAQTSIGTNYWIKAELMKQEYSPILILRKPTPDFHSPFRYRIGYAALVTIGLFFALLALITAYLHYLPLLRELRERLKKAS